MLHLSLSSAFSSVTSTICISSFTWIHGSPLWPSSLPHARLPHLEHFSTNVFKVLRLQMSKPSLTLSPDWLTCVVPLMWSFLIMFIFITPKENLNIFNSATSCFLSFGECHRLQTKQHSWSHYPLVNLYFYVCCYFFLSQITPDSTPPCLQLFPFTTLPLLWTFDPQYLNAWAFSTSTPCNLTVALSSLSHIYSVLLWLTFIPLLSSAYLYLSRFFLHLCLALTTDYNVICKTHRSQSFLPDCIIQSVRHHSKWKGTQGRSLMQSHLHVEAIYRSYSAPHHCHTAVIHIFHQTPPTILPDHCGSSQQFSFFSLRHLILCFDFALFLTTRVILNPTIWRCLSSIQNVVHLHAPVVALLLYVGSHISILLYSSFMQNPPPSSLPGFFPWYQTCPSAPHQLCSLHQHGH